MKLRPLVKNARNILIVGGTFDPPHVAHLTQAQAAARCINADVLLYLPAGRQPQKMNQHEQAPPEDRLAMVKLLIQNIPNACVCTLEMDRQHDPAWAGKPSYSVDSIAALREALGDAAQGGPTLRLLIGSDQAANFHTWHEYEKLMQMAAPAVMPRPPWTEDSLLEHIALTQSPARADQWRSYLLDMPTMNNSSTEIRERIKKGLAIEEMVSPGVASYIREQGLYRRS